MAVTTKPPDKSFYGNLCTYFGEFSSNTSVHGFKYLSENGRLAIEKLWWLVVFGVCVFACGHFIADSLNKWGANPVFVSYGQTPKYLWEIPFPAITVCPESKILQGKYNFSDNLNRKLNGMNFTPQQQKDFGDSLLMCNPPPLWNNFSHTVDSKTIDFFIRNCPAQEDVFNGCFRGESMDCGKVFSPLFTYYGLCYTFNMLDRTELFSDDLYLPQGFVQNNKTRRWSFDKGYERTKQEVYPFRARSVQHSVFLNLKTLKADIDPMCNPLKGFKLLVHHPADITEVSAFPIEIAYKSYTIYIKPTVVTTALALRKIDPKRRNCYFSNERPLRFFRIYTQNNCENECLANYTVETCGCSSFEMPQDKSTKTCSFLDKKCTDSVEEEFLRRDMEFDVLTGSQQGLCDCLPSCNSVSYEAEVLQNNIPESTNSSDAVLEATVDILFKNRIVATRERNELYGNTDFWADCGGLLSLFTGFSVMSLVEIVYYLSLRWLCNIWKFGRYAWAGFNTK